MSDTIYPCFVRIDGIAYLLAWCDSAKGDHFVLHDGSLVVADNKESLDAILGKNSLKADWQFPPGLLDGDALNKELETLSGGCITTAEQNNLFLNSWNLFEDLVRTYALENQFRPYKTELLDKLYSKVFYGCNLPAITPEEKSYLPVWNIDEVKNFQLFIQASKTTFFPKIKSSYAQSKKQSSF